MLYLKRKINIFFSKKLVYWSVLLTLAANFYLWYLIYNFIDFGKKFYVLHYNVYFGIDFIDSPQKLLNIPFLGILVLLVNIFLSYIIYTFKEKFIIPYFLLASSFFINLELIIYLLGLIRMEY